MKTLPIPPTAARDRSSGFLALTLILLTALVACPAPPARVATNVTIQIKISGYGTVLYDYSAGGSGVCSNINSPCTFTAPSGGTLTVSAQSAFGSSITAWSEACDDANRQAEKSLCTLASVNTDVTVAATTGLEVITTGDSCANFEPNNFVAQSQPRTKWEGFGALCGDTDTDLFTVSASNEQLATVAGDSTKKFYLYYIIDFRTDPYFNEFGAGTTIELIGANGEALQSSPNQRWWDSHLQPDNFSNGYYIGSYIYENGTQRFTVRVTSPHGAPRPAKLEYRVDIGIGVSDPELGAEPTSQKRNAPRFKQMRAGTISERLENGATRVGYNVLSVLRRSETLNPQRLATGPAIDPEYQRSASNEHQELSLLTGDAATLTLPDGSSVPMLQAGNVNPSRLEYYPTAALLDGMVTSSAYTQTDVMAVDATQRLEPVTNLRANFAVTRQNLEYSFTPVTGALEYTATMTSCAPGQRCRYFNFPNPLQSNRGTLDWWRNIAPGSTTTLSVTASNRATRELKPTLPTGQWNNSRASVVVRDNAPNPAAPTITGLSRTAGSSLGAGVILTGTNLLRTTQITAGALKVTQYRVLSDTMISMTMPSYYPNGSQNNSILTDTNVQVVVNNASGSSNPIEFTYRALGQNLDLTIIAAYLVQSAQDTAGSVPMIKSKPAMLWVWCGATTPGISIPPTGSASATDRNGVSLGSIPLNKNADCNEGVNALSYPNGPNAIVPNSWNQPGVKIVVELNADRRISETRYDNNRFSFTPPDPIDVPKLEVTVVPFRAYGETPNISAANLERLFAAAKRILPISELEVSLHATMQYVDVRNKQASDPGSYAEFEDSMLRMVSLLQYTEDRSGKTYVALAAVPGVHPKACYSGICGLAVAGQPALMLYDYDPQYPNYRADLTLTHELGHTFGRQHSYCNGDEPVAVQSYYSCDANYPFKTERRLFEDITPDSRPNGTFSYNITESPATANAGNIELMNGGGSNGISTYTYDGILEYRSARAIQNSRLTTMNLDANVPGAVITGKISDAGVELNAPINAGSPYRPGIGQYTIEALNERGQVVDSNRFTPSQNPLSHAHENAATHREPANFSFITSLPVQNGVTALRVRGLNGRVLLTQNLSALGRATTQSVTVQTVSAPPYKITRTSTTRTLTFNESVYSAATASQQGKIIAFSNDNTLELPQGGQVTLRLTRGFNADVFVIE